MMELTVHRRVSPDLFRRYWPSDLPRKKVRRYSKPQPIRHIQIEDPTDRWDIVRNLSNEDNGGAWALAETRLAKLGKNLAQISLITVDDESATGAPGSQTKDSIDQRIEESRQILELGDDWDDEGSVGYSKETWNKMAGYLRALHDQLHDALDAPNILPGPKGSIDLHWMTEQYEMLVNIPCEGEKATYYGDNYRLDSIKGSVDIKDVKSLVFLWLKYVGG